MARAHPETPIEIGLAAENVVGHRHESRIGRRGGRRLAQRQRQRRLVALGPQRAERDEGGCRGAADAGPAMDEHRALQVPCAGEGEQPAHMVFARQDVAVLRFHDIENSR